MTPDTAVEPLKIALDGASAVSGILQLPADASACFVFAHGAGAGMAHPFMASFAAELAACGVATLRYQFPFMERGSRRTDSPDVAHAAVRAAVAAASQRLAGMPLVAGGKSFGGRMTSQAQAAAALPGVAGLVFVGFPLHPAGRPSDARGAHLRGVHVPMLFLQGTRDALADLSLLRPLVDSLGAHALLKTHDDADHAFHVRKRSGSDDASVLKVMVREVADWLAAVLAPPVSPAAGSTPNRPLPAPGAA